MRRNPPFEYAGWFRIPGEPWERVAAGPDRARVLEALLDIVEEGELLILPTGQQPTAEHKGQVRRGNWQEMGPEALLSED